MAAKAQWVPLSAGPSSAPAPAASAALAAVPPGLLNDGLLMMKQAALGLAPRNARVVATAGLPDSRLKLAPCAAGTAGLVPGVPAWGATRLALRCTQGAAWSIQVPVKVQVFAPAVVAATALSSGNALTRNQLAVAEVDWAAHAAAPATTGLPRSPIHLYSQLPELDQRLLARPLAAGAPVRSADLQARQWFAAGATVTVVALGAGFAVMAEGQALSPGLEGQVVRVRTEGGRVVAGQATGERRVELRL